MNARYANSQHSHSTICCAGTHTPAIPHHPAVRAGNGTPRNFTSSCLVESVGPLTALLQSDHTHQHCTVLSFTYLQHTIKQFQNSPECCKMRSVNSVKSCQCCKLRRQIKSIAPQRVKSIAHKKHCFGSHTHSHTIYCQLDSWQVGTTAEEKWLQLVAARLRSLQTVDICSAAVSRVSPAAVCTLIPYIICNNWLSILCIASPAHHPWNNGKEVPRWGLLRYRK